MQDKFLTFKRLNDEAAADDLTQHLKEFDIPFIIEDTDKFFDPTFARDPMQRDIFIKLHPQDFVKAQQRLDEYYKGLIKNINSDYYLFGFTNDELIDILAKPDEWGDFDRQLSEQILKNRGVAIAAEQLAALKNKRHDELSKPASSGNNWVVVGSLMLCLGGFVAMFVGWHLYKSKKTLPDGSSIYIFNEADRQKGKLIFILASIVFALTIIAYIYFDKNIPLIPRLGY
jgi:hypothetical protein